MISALPFHEPLSLSAAAGSVLACGDRGVYLVLDPIVWSLRGFGTDQNDCWKAKTTR